MPNFIYIIEDCGNCLLKIGRSQTPEKRLRGLQTGSSSKLNLVATFEIGSNEAEIAIHEHLKRYRRNGEWFDVPKDLAMDTIEKVSKNFQQRRGGALNDNFYKDFRKTFTRIATDPEITSEPIRVLLLMLGRQNSEHIVHLRQTVMADHLGMVRSAVSRAMKLLISKGIVNKQSINGACCYRLNPD